MSCARDGVSRPARTAGDGLSLSESTFSVDAASVQRRISDSCSPGSSIRAVAEDGTVTCEPDDDTVYTDTDAVAAMGTKTESNPLHHDRYTDAEAIGAVDTADSYVRNTGDTLTGDVDMGGNSITNVTVQEAPQWYGHRKTDGDQVIDTRGETITDYSISYDVPYPHHLYISGAITAKRCCGNGTYNTHVWVRVDGTRRVFADKHGLTSNWHYYSWNGFVSDLPAGSHTIDARARPQSGPWEIEASDGTRTYLQAKVIPK